MKNKLISSSLVYTLGNLLVQGLSFITLPLYTRIISPEVYGEFNLYIAWVGLVSLFIGLQTSGSLSSAKITYSDSEYRRYAVSAVSVSNLFFVFVFLIAFLFRETWASLFSLNQNIVLILCIQSYTNYMSGFLGQYFIQHQKSMISLLISLFSSLANIALSLLLIYNLSDDFLARVLGNLFPSVLVTLSSFVYFYSRKEPWLDKKYVKFIIVISVPLIFHLLGHQLLNQLDRIMLGKMMSVQEVALYSFGYNVGLVLQIVLMSINTAWIPWFFEARKQQVSSLSKTISHYLSIGLFLTLGYLTIFPELSYLLGGETYLQGNQFIAWIILSYFFVFLYTFPVNIQFYHANTKMIPIGTLFAAGINFVLNCVLIPIQGIYGSAIATVLSYFCLLIFHHLVSKKMYHYQDVKLRTYFQLIVIALGYTFLMNFFLGNLFIRWGMGFLILIVYLMRYQEQLKQLFSKIKFKLYKE